MCIKRVTATEVAVTSKYANQNNKRKSTNTFTHINMNTTSKWIAIEQQDTNDITRQTYNSQYTGDK